MDTSFQVSLEIILKFQISKKSLTLICRDVLSDILISFMTPQIRLEFAQLHIICTKPFLNRFMPIFTRYENIGFCQTPSQSHQGQGLFLTQP